MVILEEGNPPHPRCLMCDILVPWRSLNISQKCIAQCNKGEERNWRILVVEEERAATLRAFDTYRGTLDMVPSFKYLGIVLSAADNYWPEVIQNMMKSRVVWRRIISILSRERVRPRVSGFSSNPPYSQCLSSVRIHRWLPLSWDGSWGFSRTRWCSNWPGGSCSGG